ncbi:MAG: DUF2283 domain-containing protein [Pseudonocardia sp.]
MPPEPGVSVRIDAEADAAYLRLGHGRVARTVEFAEDIFVDLDEFGVVVGIELLDLETTLPLDGLAERFRVQAATLALLVRAIPWGTPRPRLSSGGAPNAPTAFGTVVAKDLPTPA